jgi:UDP-N-acetylmuramyl tripeptide synthase
VDFEMIPDRTQVTVSGDRALDMAVRMKYADKRASAERSLAEAVTKSIAATPKGKTLFVLATYSGMLEVRKLLTGRKIL